MKALVAVDLREPRDVVAQAVPWLARFGAVADVVYVDPYREALERYLPFSVKHELDAMVAEDEQALTRLVEQIPEANRGRGYVVPGLPGEGIARLAPDYELIVLTTHGRTGPAHFWLGSVAERVARTSPKPVLVVRNPPSPGPGRMLLAVALENGRAHPPVAEVAKWAGLHSRIDLLHVDDMVGGMPTALPTMIGPRSVEILLAETARQRKWAESTLANLRDTELPEHCRGEVEVATGPVAHGIALRAGPYDLVVIGTHGRQGFTRALLGSVAERVVQRAPRSVLVLRSS